MRKALILVLLLAGSACSPEQHEAWLRWFDQDPHAAARWAADECGDLCTDDWDGDGVVEPDRGWTDITTTESESGVGVYWPWDALAECESNGDWYISTGNGFYGGLQFTLGSWHAAGGSGYPHENSPAEQVRRGEILQDMQGWNAWPTCARIVGLI